VTDCKDFPLPYDNSATKISLKEAVLYFRFCGKILSEINAKCPREQFLDQLGFAFEKGKAQY
jgi:hypothetical protein